MKCPSTLLLTSIKLQALRRQLQPHSPSSSHHVSINIGSCTAKGHRHALKQAPPCINTGSCTGRGDHHAHRLCTAGGARPAQRLAEVAGVCAHVCVYVCVCVHACTRVRARKCGPGCRKGQAYKVHAKASTGCMDYSFHMAITNWNNKVGAMLAI
eukprot:1158047-Pelagomonas_calceolata.AAC.6